MSDSFPQITKKEQAKTAVKQLIEKYERVKSQERAKEYSEQTTNKDFIMPLFEALGWDVYNKKTDDEVTAEESVSKKRVDFAFRLNGMAKLFLECKALKVDLEQEKWAEQATNYAHIKGVVWAALTNFESIKIFNSQLKSEGRIIRPILEMSYNDFLTRFDDLWLLSRESLETGFIDKIAEGRGQKFKKVPVGEQLLLDLTTWRSRLSKDVLERNKSKNLTEDDLDESVQRILDRLIFIRKCEDSELEQPNLLLSTVREWEGNPRGTLAKHIFGVFSQFDKIYDSRLFLPHLCDDLEISNQVISEVINGLYHTKDRAIQYDFSAIDADILGSVYEQYLGHILKKTAKRATVTEKHAHRKEQGIYYTPTYIVDYIVKNTLGELLKTKSPKEAEKIRVLDPACGSGSFLIKTFDVFDKYFKKASGSQQELEFARRSKILTENIYGVDLDPKAVEIAQLNLLLKTAEKKERLPMLQNNIKCGNSLIDDPAVAKERAFKWDEQFQKIMKDEGGFDVVIGNPPYIRNRELDLKEKKLFETRYQSATGQYDIYQLFFEKSIELLKEGGLLGFITSNKYAITSYGEKLRKFILDNCRILSIIDVSNIRVFKDASTYPYILVLQKTKSEKSRNENKIKILKANTEAELLLKPLALTQSDFLRNGGFVFNLTFNHADSKIFSKIEARTKKLGEIATIKETVHTGNIREKLISSSKSGTTFKKLLRGKDCQRYFYKWNDLWINTDLTVINKSKGEYATVPDKYYFEQPKLFLREIAERITACYDEANFYSLNKAYVIISNDKKIPLKFILGLLNSKLLSWYFRSKFESAHVRGGHLQFKKQYTSQIPIKEASQSEQTTVVKLVDKMLSLNERLLEIGDKKTDERARLEEEIKRTDAEIDELVYELYGITDEERKIVEESLKK